MLTAEQRTLTALRMGVLPGEPIPVVNEFPSWAQTKQVLLNPVVVASGLFYLCSARCGVRIHIHSDLLAILQILSQYV
jgi:hypothetical protein